LEFQDSNIYDFILDSHLDTGDFVIFGRVPLYTSCVG